MSDPYKVTTTRVICPKCKGLGQVGCGERCPACEGDRELEEVIILRRRRPKS